MMYESPFVAELVAYCPETRETAVKFIESRGDVAAGKESQETELAAH